MLNFTGTTPVILGILNVVPVTVVYITTQGIPVIDELEQTDPTAKFTGFLFYTTIDSGGHKYAREFYLDENLQWATARFGVTKNGHNRYHLEADEDNDHILSPADLAKLLMYMKL